MQLFSTNSPQQSVSLRQAVLEGLPKDNGLYMPKQISPLPKSFFQALPSLSFPELSFQVAHHLLGESISSEKLREIVFDAMNFDTPVHWLDSQTGILELFHGPTLAFKDVGARFMARLMGHFVENDPETLTILVATSGDTGGAVASGFFQTPGIEVVILYPKGKVSPLQEKQLTTLGHNVQALRIDGSFDDCQAMVKSAFLDQELQSKRRLSSANSINIARLIPQSFYYFRAWQQVENPEHPLCFVVPSGNFGNLTAGLFAAKMGLPIAHFVAATNANDVVPQYLAHGKYLPRPSVRTISNAMDVGRPSNFVRMDSLFDSDWQMMRQMISGFAYNDTQTREAIRKVEDKFGYIIDPHGAVGVLAWEAFRRQHPQYQGIILETAHPAKFLEVMAESLDKTIDLPPAMAALVDKKCVCTDLPASFDALKSELLAHA
ncbi:MAG: threonine synthase [Bacteroidota bacterium]